MLTYQLLGIIFTLTSSVKATNECGYEACDLGKADMLNVHIVSHTHDDVGWVMTVEQYYRTYVRDIIHSVVYSLQEKPTRRFIYVEVEFFYRWWNEQSQVMKERVKNLINTGQLEFTSGGWTMNDEATTHYTAIVDEMSLGHRWLNETFGPCGRPLVGWQIDPFGHSREEASLFAQMYFDGLLLGRIDHEDKGQREATQTMEFVWKTSSSLGKKSDLFTGILPNVYWPPKGFCFDIACDNEEVTDSNANRRAREFISMVEKQAKHYKTNHTILTLGMDFHYRYAGKWFKNIERLIAAVNNLQTNGSKVNAIHSTPACYIYALNNLNTDWPTKEDDFFPYSTKPDEYWTGYFTSRPTFKYYSRRANAFLQTCRQITALTNTNSRSDIFILESIDQNLGLTTAKCLKEHNFGGNFLPQCVKKKLTLANLQSGPWELCSIMTPSRTEKQFVTNDYSKFLSDGIQACQNLIRESYGKLLGNVSLGKEIHFCNLLNVSQCAATESNDGQVKVFIFNSLSREIDTYIKLPIPGEGFYVEDFRGFLMPTQVAPIPESVLSLPERSSEAQYEIIFPARLPPLGVTTYTLKEHDDLLAVPDKESTIFDGGWEDVTIGNEFLQVFVDGLTGMMSGIRINHGHPIPVKQSFQYYDSQPGFEYEKASGAYAFNPRYNTPTPVTAVASFKVVKGLLVEEIHQTFSKWVTQVIRVYKGQPFVELDWIVGPIPINDNVGKEVISKFDTQMASNGVFFTDSNGRENIKRKRNFRPTWNLTVTEPIAGNFYPVTAWIYMRDEALQLSVLTDRAQGGSSITDGSLELMVHRRMLFDDGFGVDEALNEPGTDGQGLRVRGKHYLLLKPINESVRLQRDFAKVLFHEPELAFLKVRPGHEADETNRELHISGILYHLPTNIHILTLQRLPDKRILLRLEHYYEVGDDSELSKPVIIPLKKLFEPFTISAIEETTLAANQYLKDARRFRWRTKDDTQNDAPSADTDTTEDNGIEHGSSENFSITIHPMEIRTFIVTTLQN